MKIAYKFVRIERDIFTEKERVTLNSSNPFLYNNYGKHNLIYEVGKVVCANLKDGPIYVFKNEPTFDDFFSIQFRGHQYALYRCKVDDLVKMEGERNFYGCFKCRLIKKLPLPKRKKNNA